MMRRRDAWRERALRKPAQEVEEIAVELEAQAEDAVHEWERAWDRGDRYRARKLTCRIAASEAVESVQALEYALTKTGSVKGWIRRWLRCRQLRKQLAGACLRAAAAQAEAVATEHDARLADEDTNRLNSSAIALRIKALFARSQANKLQVLAEQPLSKSKVLAGMQCLKRLYYQCYRSELASAPSQAQQAIFETGQEVGRLAMQLFPKGILVEEDSLNHNEAVARTRILMKQADVPAIFEGAFEAEGVRIRADILEHVSVDCWRLLEVKSGTKVKSENLYDVAVQKQVLEKAGIELESTHLIHLNNQYIYDGMKLDLESLFSVEDISETIEPLVLEIPGILKKQRAALVAEEPPEIGPSMHCSKPYGCEFYGFCRSGRPEHWVGDLPRIRAKELAALEAKGLVSITDVPIGYQLSPLQRLVCDCVRKGEPFIDHDGLRTMLRVLEFPLYFLDFETIAPAIPRYARTRPYQVIPFQWSLHTLEEDGTLRHDEYLCREDKDPRKELADALVGVLGTRGDRGSIVCYSSYEARILRDLIASQPEHAADFTAILSRLFDLHPVIRDTIYHPDFHGSFSLKAVQPALLPEMGTYGDLAIGDGSEAGVAYLRMIAPTTPLEEADKTYKNLLQYCERDTLSTVELYRKLRELTS